MPMIRCSQGHFFDDQKHSSCPWCGVSSLDLDLTGTRLAIDDTPKTVAVSGRETIANTASNIAEPDSRTAKIFSGAAGASVPEEGRTVAISKKKMGMDPVVGWLVCVAGPEKGKDYRIHSEKNTLGRSDSMDIAVKGDSTISRENHAYIVFNPKNRIFRVQPGDARGLVYVNDEEVVTSRDLQNHDFIELGESKFCFVPFCGENFCWEEMTVAGNDNK